MSKNDKGVDELLTVEILNKLDGIPGEEFNDLFEGIMKREPFSYIEEKMSEFENRFEQSEKELKALKEMIRKHLHVDAGIALLIE